MTLRAIIMIAELIGFVIFLVFCNIVLYKLEYDRTKNELTAKSTLKSNVKFSTGLFAIIILLFTFSYPSYLFFSYNKLILVSITVICWIGFLLIIIFLDYNNIFYVLLLSADVTTWIVVTAVLIGGDIDIKGEYISMEHKSTVEMIRPSIVSRYSVGYRLNGDVKTYLYYYQDDEGNWCLEELKASEVEIIPLESYEYTYVEKVSKSKDIIRGEKKESSKDYSYTETKESYKLHINEEDFIKIKD